MSLKLMTIVGTRPEIIKLSRIIPALDSHFEHTFVHTGQNYDYELNEIFFKEMRVRKPDFFLETAKGTASQTIAEVIARSDQIMGQIKPEAVLLYGDTNSCLSVISAKRRQIPIFHMEAGNRCFDQRVPEELNRKIVDHLSDLNMVHCEHARKYLIREGLPPARVIKTGTPMGEVLQYYQKEIQESDILKTLGLKSKEYFIVSAHREENIDIEFNFESLLKTLNQIAEHFGKRVIVSTHPRTRKKIEIRGKTDFHKLIEFMKPLGFFDYNKLQRESLCVISDSGTITEEASLLKFPGIMIRKAHERPEGMDVGAVIMSGLHPQRVVESIHMATQSFKKESVRDIEDYQSLHVSTQVVKIIQSYTDYINRVVWQKFL